MFNFFEKLSDRIGVDISAAVVMVLGFLEYKEFIWHN